jgi:hypothetical protein
MNKALTLLLTALFVFSTVVATDPQLMEEMTNTAYCGPNEINCNPVEIDVVFVIDSTGSMYDEIRTVKEEVTNIIHNINSGYPRPNLKVGVVTYRDYADDYLVRDKQLTSNTYSVINFIRNIEANGGGDYEEAVEIGLSEAINDMNWRSNSERIIILVGDAPARNNPDYDQHGNQPENIRKYDWKDAVEDARDNDIRIYTAAGSGMNDEGVNQWKTIARKTGGSFIHLIYERRVIDEYYTERAIPKEYATEARASKDYDASTDSVMTNNLGLFAKTSMMQVAEEAGVEYDSEGSLDEITGDIIKPQPKNDLKNFFEKIFQSIKFW